MLHFPFSLLFTIVMFLCFPCSYYSGAYYLMDGTLHGGRTRVILFKELCIKCYEVPARILFFLKDKVANSYYNYIIR